MLCFHSYWRREDPNPLPHDMTILPRVEGEVKIYLDGDTRFPASCGTGTEDYIGDGYGQTRFCCRFFGDQYVSPSKDAYEFYRLHIPDPIWFYKNIRVTIQDMRGPSYQAMLDDMNKYPSLRLMKAGDGKAYYARVELAAHPRRSNVVERSDDYCAAAYWFMDRPESELPPIAPAAERTKDLP